MVHAGALVDAWRRADLAARTMTRWSTCDPGCREKQRGIPLSQNWNHGRSGTGTIDVRIRIVPTYVRTIARAWRHYTPPVLPLARKTVPTISIGIFTLELGIIPSGGDDAYILPPSRSIHGVTWLYVPTVGRYLVGSYIILCLATYIAPPQNKSTYFYKCANCFK